MGPEPFIVLSLTGGFVVWRLHRKSAPVYSVLAPSKAQATYYRQEPNRTPTSDALKHVIARRDHYKCQVSGVRVNVGQSRFVNRSEPGEFGHLAADIYGGKEEKRNLQLQARSVNRSIGSAFLQPAIEMMKKNRESAYLTDAEVWRDWFPGVCTHEQLKAERARRKRVGFSRAEVEKLRRMV